MRGEIPVSYTHLDVYKRQALRSASGAGMARIESVMPLGHYTQIILVRADGARLKVFIPKEQALGYIPGQTADYSFTRFKQFGAAQASA